MLVEHSRRHSRAIVVALALATLGAATPDLQTPAAGEAVRFAVIGDMGTGGRRQIETGRRLAAVRERFPYSFVLTTGDNIYGGETPADLRRKFEVPYKDIIDAGIPFYASLGNHDGSIQANYKLFNMNGKRYYTFVKGAVQFFALDSSFPTRVQLGWLEGGLKESKSPWKIVYQHHPLYSSGIRHGPTESLQSNLEPLLTTFGVQVVFAGHEHFYERLVPRYGIHHFITGSGGQLRRNGIRKGSKDTAAGFDQDNSFMLVAIDGDTLSFEVVSRTGATVDRGTIPRVPSRPESQ
ncbi:MAG: metallophosphoesterase [Vicinamibacterales bacterium]